MSTQYLTIKELAEHLNLRLSTLRTNVSRAPESIPPFLRVGKLIRFPIAELDKWESEQLSKTLSHKD